MDVAFYDATNPRAREFVWGKVRDNYLRPYGIDVCWLDACEPELRPGTRRTCATTPAPASRSATCTRGRTRGRSSRGCAEEGLPPTVSLNRSAWAGSQRYGAALWSGDIPATFASLRAQITAGLNIAVSGIPWWTTDIGGFHGGDPASTRSTAS